MAVSTYLYYKSVACQVVVYIAHIVNVCEELLSFFLITEIVCFSDVFDPPSGIVQKKSNAEKMFAVKSQRDFILL